MKSYKEIKQEFTELLNKKNNSTNETKHLAQMLMYRFLSEIERVTDERNITRTALANSIGLSASYITQLYKGNKPLNIETLSKIEKVLELRFDVKLIDQEVLEIDKDKFYDWSEEKINAIIEKNCVNGLRLYRSNRNYKEQAILRQEVNYNEIEPDEIQTMNFAKQVYS